MSGVESRAVIEASVRRELVGPDVGSKSAGNPLNCDSGVVHFDTAEASRGQFHDQTSGEELLTQGEPLKRYGVGILHSGVSQRGAAIATDDSSEQTENADLTWVSGVSDSEDLPLAPPPEMSGTLKADEADSDDFDLTDANKFKPAAMAISFKAAFGNVGAISIEVQYAYYDRIQVHIPGVSTPRTWWLRRPVLLDGSITSDVLHDAANRLSNIPLTPRDGQKPRLVPDASIYVRDAPNEEGRTSRLITVSLVNASPGTGSHSALFQVGMKLSVGQDTGITPYPESNVFHDSEEEQSSALLYRAKRTYAVGHGVAAEWGNTDSSGVSVQWVKAEPMPAFEVPSLTPDIYVRSSDGSRRPVTVSMGELAAGSAKGREQVDLVLQLYSDWISAREAEIDALSERYRSAALVHVRKCREALSRMEVGWRLALNDPLASRCFRLANEAMLHQQVRSRLPYRVVERGRDDILRPQGRHPDARPTDKNGNWRPFQIAFVLASLPELVEPDRPKRSVVDLIFFPTGGGKTEAYLGASAISLLARRLRDPGDAGTDTLMRYTLRLLTAQQFLRAAALVCVLEDIRSENVQELGEAPFGIGIWLGGSSTPNRWAQAVSALGRMRKRSQEPNVFLLLRCPWCGTQMGTKPRGKSGQDVIGYEQSGKKVIFRCIDQQCRFSGRRGLPVHVVDDDIYEVRPSIVIGTVDKFAMMAWRPMARRIFGLDDSGTRDVSPPNLIIQDELHLISGPLGSMVGLYEAVIDDLCTDKRGALPIPPKIIASTATISRYKEQIRGVFGREEVALFPPHGLEEGHSFFAEPDTDDDGELLPGRRYLGVMSASLGSTQTVQVRVAAATLQAAENLSESDRDGYWTNLNFLNSLRELGNTVSLLESDVPDYLTAMRRRDGIDPRWPRNTMELTSRRRNDEIPRAIQQLEAPYGDQGCVDICLASNIIEVGVDIERLALMTIVGQPKTTAQYIQVSGRVGRRPQVSPGLVITIYGAAKPRDRSHYERFQSYHQQLYAQVEPTSVTPFAVPVLQRALHAVAVAHIRQCHPGAEPSPFPRESYDAAIELLRARASVADPTELSEFEKVSAKRSKEWATWERTEWDANSLGGDPIQGLMRFAGTLPDLDSKATIWDVPTSMRNVDAECRLKISTAYVFADAEEDGEE